MDNLQAAFFDVKMKYLPNWRKRGQEIAEKYRMALSEIDELILPHYDDSRGNHVYQNYVIRSKQDDEFSNYLRDNGVKILIQFRELYYGGETLKLENRGFPETEELSREGYSLPMNPGLTGE